MVAQLGGNMPHITTRSLIKFGSGSGLVVTIPRAWADYYGLKAGNKVEVITNGELRLRPVSRKRTKRR